MLKAFFTVLSLAILLASSSFAQSPSSNTKDAELAKLWVKLGGVGIFYHSSAAVSAMGSRVPGGTAFIADQATATFDLGYDLPKHISVSLMGGVPAKPALYAAGTLASYGRLGSVTYGPAVASAHYHFFQSNVIQPYVGGGLAYAIIFSNHDAVLHSLKVKNNFGSAVQAGVDCQFTKKLGAYVDFKQLWLGVDASGNIYGIVPATARVTLNPTLLDVGLKYRF